MVSRFFATGDTSSEEESYDEAPSQEVTKNEKISNVKSFINSSSDEDENRVVRSSKDKQFDDLEKTAQQIKKNIQDDDWVSISENFEDLQRKLLKAANVIKTHGFPRFYLKCVVDLETAAVDLNNDKDGKAELDKEDQRAHGLVLLKVRKHITQFAKQIDAYKKQPDVSEEEDTPAPVKKAAPVAAKKPTNKFSMGDSDSDEDDEEVAAPVNKKLPAAKPTGNSFAAFGGDSDEEDEDDDAPPTVFTDDEMPEDDEEEPEDDIDYDIEDVSLISDKITRDFWVKKDKGPSQAELKKEKVRRPKAQKQGVEEEDEDGTHMTKAEKQRRELLKARANEEVTPAAMTKRIREVVAARGKRSVDQNAMINELRFLETKAHDVPTLLRVQTLLALFVIDNYSRRGGSMSLDEWRECITNAETILKTLNSNPTVRLAEDDTFSDSSLDDENYDAGVNMEDFVDDVESAAWMTRRTKMVEEAKAKAALEEVVEDTGVTYVEGNLYSFVFKVSSEFYTGLRLLDHTNTDYITRLKEQPRLIALFKAARAYYQSIHKPRLEARIVQLWIEYEYYYYQAKYDVLAGAAEDMPTLVDELAAVAYVAEDPRSRVRALLFQCYFWCVHNRYEQARERLMMSHIQDAINELDISTRILYNRTLVQLGLAAFRRGEYRAVLSSMSDLFANPIRIKELLAQGIKKLDDTKEEEIAEAKRRLYPYHMHINADLLDATHLISALIVEIPNIAEVGWSRRIVSRSFRRYYQSYLAYLAYSTHIDNVRDIIMSAAKALYDGDWKKSYDALASLKIWSYVPQAETVKQVLKDKLQREALRSYLFTNGSHYTCISLDALKEKFALSEPVIMQITSKMLHSDLIPGAWDVTAQPPCIVITAPATNKIQKCSLQFVDKIQQFAERLDVPQKHNTNKNDDASQNKQKWGDRRKAFSQANRNGRKSRA